MELRGEGVPFYLLHYPLASGVGPCLTVVLLTVPPEQGGILSGSAAAPLTEIFRN